MDDIDMDLDKLSIPARQTLQVLDSYIDAIADQDVILKTDELQLYFERWVELEQSITYQSRIGSGDEMSLTTHPYRGMVITQWDGS